MASDLEKAQLMSVLARSKGNWGAKYDRIEHFKRFQNLIEIVKELSKVGWIIVCKKSKFTGISLNAHYVRNNVPEHPKNLENKRKGFFDKKEIIDFIEKEMPHLQGMIK